MEGPHPPGAENPPGGGDPHAGNPQQGLIGGGVDLHREEVQVGQGPAALGVHPGVEVLGSLVQQLLRPEAIEPQQPVRLIEPVLPQKRRLHVLGGEEGVLHHGDVGGIEHTF